MEEIKNPTVFCDLDGTIFIYRKFSDITKIPAKKIKSTVDYLKRLKKEGAHIVITTARPQNLRGHTVEELVKNQIPYDQLVMGIERGKRILINDSDAGSSIPRAFAIPLIRDKGVQEDQIKDI